MGAMLDPDEIASRVPTWLKLVLVGVLVVVASGAGLFAYRYFTLPTTLTIAAGSYDGEAARVMSAIASRLTKTGASIRLKIVESGTALEAAKTFAAGKVDLATVRADAGDLSAARTVVLVTHGVAMIVVPPGSSIDSIDGLKGKTVGVVGGEINHRIVDLLTSEYELTRAKVQFRDLALADVQQALRSRQVSALLVVIPLTEKYLSMLRNLFPGNAKQKPSLIAIDSAGAIANVAQAYESYDIPKGTLRGSPPIPDDDLTTLRVPFYLVANKKLGDDAVTELTKAIMDSRRDLLAEFPLLAQIAAPSTDKDAFIPVHPGAAAFFDGTQQDFFDKYSNALYYGPMLLGGLASVLAAIWKFIGVGGNGRAASPLDPLYALAGRIRAAASEAELATVEDELDTILKLELTKYAKGNVQAADAAALSLAAHRLEYLINYRRNALSTRPGAIAAE
jgi:TRAP transporter TAXI family solute receptor